MNADRLLVTLCTYNERENLESIISEIWQYAPEADILVIDDNSPDGTGRFADDWAAREPRLHVLHRLGKMGLGSAILAGLGYAIDHSYDFVLNLDADFSHHPRYIPNLLECMTRADVAIGSRYIKGGGVVDWGLKRWLMSCAINWYARLLLRLRPRDSSGGYRCYRVSKLRELDLGRVRARGYAFQQEILYRCRRIGCRFEETPIIFEDRRHGFSKISWRIAVEALWVIFVLAIDELRRVPVKSV